MSWLSPMARSCRRHGACNQQLQVLVAHPNRLALWSGKPQENRQRPIHRQHRLIVQVTNHRTNFFARD